VPVPAASPWGCGTLPSLIYCQGTWGVSAPVSFSAMLASVEVEKIKLSDNF